jgi:hypothetical protein
MGFLLNQNSNDWMSVFNFVFFFPLTRFWLHLSLHSKFQRVLNGEIRKKRSTLVFLIRFICKLADSWIKSAFGEAYVASSCVISSGWVYSGKPYCFSFYPRKVFGNQTFMSTFGERKAKRDRFLIQPSIILKTYFPRSVSIVHSKNHVADFTSAKTYSPRLSKSTKSKILLILIIDCTFFKKWNSRER